MTFPFLSIIIPAYNEERRLPRTLEQVFHFLAGQHYTAEVVVVENGSSDRTLEIANEFARRYENLRVLREVARGKGLAVRRGMLEARGQYRFICDADLSMPIQEVAKFLPPTLANFDVAIGSREAPGSVRYNEPPYRHWGGRAINIAIRSLILPGLQDTQCGFKCFTAEAASTLFNLQTDRLVVRHRSTLPRPPPQISHPRNSHPLVFRSRNQTERGARCPAHDPGYFRHPSQRPARIL